MSSGEVTVPSAATREIYLDWNATAPPLREALAAVHSTAASLWGNPSSVHATGRRALEKLEEARAEIARWVGAAPRELVFTSGGTEANNLALGAAAALVTSRLEHPSITRVAERLEREGVPVRWVPVPEAGRLDPADVAVALEGLGPGAVVAMGGANHETGVLQPVQAIARVAWDAGARLHLDAVQSIGKVAGHPLEWADSTAIAAHKLRGPKGIGALAWRPGAGPRPVLVGGAQERGLRPGTQDAALAAGFAVAARHAGSRGPEREARLGPLRDRLEEALLPLGTVNGAGAPRLAHVANLSLHGWRADVLVAALDLEGLRASSGSACSAGTAEASPVIEAMLGRERAEASIRFSLGETTTADEIERAIAIVRVVAARLSGRGGREAHPFE